MQQKLEEILNEKISSTHSLGGGSIASSFVIETESGKKYFSKTYGNNNVILKSEVSGLRELAFQIGVRIPKIIATNSEFLILEYIESGKKQNDFFTTFGRQFAQFHRTTENFYGFYENNFIGSTPQINLPQNDNWIDFFWENRLLFQFNLAEQNGFVDSSFRNLINKLEKAFPSILDGTDEPPTLLHGDLWSGNFMVDENSNPVLIDPAVYYGHREADLAMTKMFGGFDSNFYHAYNEEYPLLYDWEERINLYMLYHVLNHLNLFGSGYYSQAVSIIKKYVK